MRVAIKELSGILLVQRHSAAGWPKAGGTELQNQGADSSSGNRATELHSILTAAGGPDITGGAWVHCGHFQRKLDQI